VVSRRPNALAESDRRADLLIVAVPRGDGRLAPWAGAASAAASSTRVLGRASFRSRSRSTGRSEGRAAHHARAGPARGGGPNGCHAQRLGRRRGPRPAAGPFVYVPEGTATNCRRIAARARTFARWWRHPARARSAAISTASPRPRAAASDRSMWRRRMNVARGGSGRRGEGRPASSARRRPPGDARGPRCRFDERHDAGGVRWTVSPGGIAC